MKINALTDIVQFLLVLYKMTHFFLMSMNYYYYFHQNDIIIRQLLYLLQTYKHL